MAEKSLGKGGINKELTTQIKDGGAARNIKNGENCALPSPSYTAMSSPSSSILAVQLPSSFGLEFLSLLLVYLHIVGF